MLTKKAESSPAASTEGQDGRKRNWLPPQGPTGQLGPVAWLSAPETKALVAALQARGARIRFVGGAVRDAVLGQEARDVDVATPDRPETVQALLAEAGIASSPTGIDHGTVTALIGEKRFEITTLRVDVETDGRHALVAFTDDWLADAKRRDFTINALSATPDGMIHDPFDGLRDLADGRIRFIGSAERRVTEDALRILRYFRFFARYGRHPADIDALAACRKLAPTLADLSAERVRAEMMGILEAGDPADTLLMMQGERVLPHLLPQLADFGRLRQLAFLESRGLVRPGIGPDPLRRLAAALPADADAARAVAERLSLPAPQRKRLLALAAPGAVPAADWTPARMRRLLHESGTAIAQDLVLLSWAGARATLGTSSRERHTGDWNRLLDEAQAWTAPTLPVTGQDVLAQGVPPGPEVGRILADIERWWIEGDFRAGRADALERIRRQTSGPV